jgi:acetyl-CoA C-acetyltransferase
MSEAIVIAGWGQVTQPKNATPPLLDPIDMMERAARDAAAQAGARVLERIDAILAVRTQSRNLTDPAGDLARRLGARPRLLRVSGVGGQVPQQFVNQAAGLLARGEAQTVLICGAETYYPRSADAVRGEWALGQGIPADYAEEDAVGSSALERRHGLLLPIHGFPLFEVALWAESRLSREQWLARVGTMWAGFSEAAARHPNAWTRSALTAGEITTPAADNRPIAFPYTKRMVSLVMADIGAAVIMTTARRAAAARGGGGQAVYFRGGAVAKDRQRFMAEKSDFTRSPALAQAAAKAQARAHVRAEDIECFDLYSCFPCAVSVARRELRLDDGDPRPLTLTGGLGFFGGPGSNYALHGIATMAETIASGRYRSGMTTALGWFMHKYAVGIYGAAANEADFGAWDREDEARPEAGASPVAIAERAEGHGRIETYTVIYDRDQTPARALVYGRTEGGQRFVANTAGDAPTYAELTRENQVGRAVRLGTVEGMNRAELAG